MRVTRIKKDEATRGTMPPPMSALITAKDSNDDLVEVVLFEKFNDLRGFGRRLFLPFDVSFLIGIKF